MKLTITKIGVPKQIKTSKGMSEKNYIKATEYGDKFLNYWVGVTTKNWKVGDVVEVDGVEEEQYINKEGNPGTSHNIKLPRYSGSGISPAQQEFQTNVMMTLTNILNKVNGIGRTLEERLGVVISKDETIPKDVADANAELEALASDYPEPHGEPTI